MFKSIALYISSCTGNTLKIANVIQARLEKSDYELYIHNSSKSNIIPKDADLIIIFFWCRKSSLDFNSKNIVDMCENKKILAFGTMGNYPNSDYGQKVKSNVFDYISKNNKCLGVFLCQGKIPPERTEKRMKLSPDHPHHLDEDGIKRHLDSRTHPDKRDLQNAAHFLEGVLEKF